MQEDSFLIFLSKPQEPALGISLLRLFFSLSLDPDCILQVFVYAFACSNTCSFHAVEHGWRSRGREAVPCCSSRRNVYKTIRSLREILVRVMRRKPRVRYGEGGGGGGIRSIKNRFAGISLYVAMGMVHVANAIFLRNMMAFCYRSSS